VGSSGVKGRVAVGPGLHFGEPPKGHTENRDAQGKFKGALDAVAAREERRRKGGKSGDDAPDEDGEEPAPDPSPAPARAGPRVLANGPEALEARRRALLAKVPGAKPTFRPGVPVPREIAEAVTDPHIRRPALGTPPTDDETGTFAVPVTDPSLSFDIDVDESGVPKPAQNRARPNWETDVTEPAVQVPRRHRS
jgi:hypothetical protein